MITADELAAIAIPPKPEGDKMAPANRWPGMTLKSRVRAWCMEREVGITTRLASEDLGCSHSAASNALSRLEQDGVLKRRAMVKRVRGGLSIVWDVWREG